MAVIQPARASDEAACPAQLRDQCGALALETRLCEAHSLCRAFIAPGLQDGCARDPVGTRFPEQVLIDPSPLGSAVSVLIPFPDPDSPSPCMAPNTSGWPTCFLASGGSRVSNPTDVSAHPHWPWACFAIGLSSPGASLSAWTLVQAA